MPEILIIEVAKELRSAVEKLGRKDLCLRSVESAAAALDRQTNAVYDVILWNIESVRGSLAEVARSLKHLAKDAEQDCLSASGYFWGVRLSEAIFDNRCFFVAVILVPPASDPALSSEGRL